jgi:hypothetical protein
MQAEGGKKGVMEMAGTSMGSVVLRSVPCREVERKVAFYLAAIDRNVSVADVALFLTHSKPLTIVRDVTREKGQALAEAINGLGACAYFLQNLKMKSSPRQ